MPKCSPPTWAANECGRRTDSDQLIHRAACRIERSIRVRPPLRVRVRNRDRTELRTRDLVRGSSWWRTRIEELDTLVRVAVRPPIHGDREDVARGIEPMR